MSAIRTTHSRKRESENECSSSDSDEICGPFKKYRIVSEEPNPVHRRMILFQDYFASRIRGFFDWFHQLPVGSNNDKERVLKIGKDGLELEDDDDVETAIFLEEEFKRMSDNSNRRENSTRERNSCQPVNGCNNGITNSRMYKRHVTITHKDVAPITNPSLDVDLLSDLEKTPYKESSIQIALEFLNEGSHGKIARQTLSVPKVGQTSKEHKDASPGSFIKGKATYEKQRPLNKPSEDYEVLIQERRYYEIIVEKVVGLSTCYLDTPKKDPKAAGCQINLTRKVALEKPVFEFLRKYYKPFQFNPCTTPKDNSEIEIITVE